MIFLGNTNTVVDVRKGLEPIQKIMNGSTEIFNGIPTEQQYVYRQSAGNGVCYIRTHEGKSLVWNQLVKSCTTKAEVYGITRTRVNNYTVHYSGTSTQTTSFTGTDTNINVIKGHKYYAAANGAPSNTFLRGGTGLPMAQNVKKAVIQATEDTSQSSLGVNIPLGISVDNDISFVLFDLTLMFGAGNEPSTVADFEKLYPLPYYAYNAGTIVNNAATGLETVGFNQWDEEWERGSYNLTNGVPTDYANNFRTKNPIKVVAGTYYMKTPYASFVLSYDAEGNYLGNTPIAANGGTFTPQSGAAYILFTVVASWADYGNNICINISDASRNGTYEPYWKKSIQLGLNAFRVTDGTNIITVNGLKSAGSVYDEIDPIRKKYIKRIEEVDLGGIDWNYSSASHRFYNNTALNDAEKFSNAAGVGPIICSKYTPDSYANTSINLHDKSIAILFQTNVDSGLYVYDSGAGTDEAAFKTAMSGVMLNYVLATPVEYDLVDDIPNAIEVDENGTERAIFPVHLDGAPSAPFRCQSNYYLTPANVED